MNDLDPNYLLPLWQAVITYFRHFRPLVQSDQRLDTPGSRRAHG